MKKILGRIKNEKGISLVELVLAVAIFSIVVTIASGMFINSIKAQKAIIAKQNVSSDLRYSADFMLKELRMSQINSTDPTLTFKNASGVQLIDSNSPSSTLDFINSNGDEIIYSLSGGKIMRENFTAATSVQSVSSDMVEITSLRFVLNNWDLSRGAASSVSPLITVWIKARSRTGTGESIEFQTSISPRIY